MRNWKSRDLIKTWQLKCNYFENGTENAVGGLIGNHNYVTTAYPLAPILTTSLDDVEGCSHAVCLSSGIFHAVVQWLTRIQLY